MSHDPATDRAFRLFGTRVAEPQVQVLGAGRMSVQLVGGGLRKIAYDGIEVLRAIAFVVRDRDWGTYSPAITDLTIEEGAQITCVSYRALCHGPESTLLSISVSIALAAHGGLTFRAEAETPTGFETNRCGFCVLHPILGLAGSPVIVEHVDGRLQNADLPFLIEPWQPFQDIRALTHQVMPGVDAQCRMEGDTFEMEDQRNWSDASYKTYVRPLALPWPYEIAVGQTVLQAVTLTVTDTRGEVPPAESHADQPIHLTWGEDLGRLPEIGLVVTPEEAKSACAALAAYGAFGATGLLLHFDPEAGHGFSDIQAFATLAASFSSTTSLEIALPCQRPLAEELGEIARFVADAGLRLDAVMVSPSVDRQSTPPGSRWPDCPALEAVYAAARAAFPDVQLGGGMLSYFTEINRKRVPAEPLDFISHATNPIVHAADDTSVMQTLEALPFIGASVRAIYGQKPYRMGPSTIAMRQNPYGSRTMDNPNGERIAMASRDPRHNGLFGAAFAVGSAAAFVGAGLEQLTLAALTGPFGLFAGPQEPVPEGTIRPIGRSIELLASMAGWKARAVRAGSSRDLLAFGGRCDDGRCALMLVNVTGSTLKVDCQDLGITDMASMVMLDEASMVAAASHGLEERNVPASQLSLMPYAVVKIVWEAA
ncbi:hypothetical protein [Rhizobium sp. FY34]|uniref:D-apionate lactonase n=1 Tax=Rhizobium sp. FY34 TaxID=2562309 RepID=UPI0010C0EB21|nr:hypothetical protein [Rhizobium sp. FY34]